MKRNTVISIIFILFCLAMVPSAALAKDEFVVVIDPGHGGGDVGTPHRKMKQDEKTIALNVALKLGALIEQNYKDDIKVVYTRKTDKYPTLPERTVIAKEAKGDLFISIHVNAAADASARGFETYVFGITGLQGKSEAEQKRIRERTMAERENLDINGKQIDFESTVDIETKILCQAQREKHNKYSLEVAHYVQDNIMSALHRSSYASRAHDRGVKAKNIYVLCYSPMPAILIELGYMSNVNEEKFINSDEAQTLFAKSIFQGVKQYHTNWKRRLLHDDDASGVQKEQPVAAAVQPIDETPAPAIDTKTKPEAERPAKSQPVTKPAASKGDEVHYRIQFLTSPVELKEGDAKLKGLWPVQYYMAGGMYKYTYGDTTSKGGLQKDMIRIKGIFPDAFLVKFDANGNRIK